MARPAKIHITLVVQAWRVAPFARQATARTSPSLKMGPGPPQAARGPPGVSLCHPRAAQQPPRRPRRRPQHALPRVHAMSSATTLETPDTAVGRAMCIVHETKESSTPAEVLTKMAHIRWAVVELLRT